MDGNSAFVFVSKRTSSFFNGKGKLSDRFKHLEEMH